MASEHEPKRLRWNLTLGGLVLAALGVWLSVRDGACTNGDATSAPDAESAATATSATSEQGGAPVESSDSGAGGGDAGEPQDGGPVLDRAKADRMRAAIWKALAMQGAGGAGGSSAAGSSGAAYPEMPSAESGDGGALRDYIKSVVHDQYLPLAKQCYEASLAKDPKVHGRIALGFDIVGDTKIGGVVDNAEYDDEQTTIIDPELRTCLRESMMSVSFDAPPKTGKLTVKYPITFEPDGPPDE